MSSHLGQAIDAEKQSRNCHGKSRQKWASVRTSNSGKFEQISHQLHGESLVAIVEYVPIQPDDPNRGKTW